MNPASRDGQTLTVLGTHGRPIRLRKNGTKVPKIAFYARLIKDGDLLIVSKTEATKQKTKNNKGGR